MVQLWSWKTNITEKLSTPQAEARNFRKEAERIARDVFKRNGIHHPNKEQIRRLAQQPKVVRQAKRRLAVKVDL
jgi:hypothetical protein